MQKREAIPASARARREAAEVTGEGPYGGGRVPASQAVCGEYSVRGVSSGGGRRTGRSGEGSGMAIDNHWCASGKSLRQMVDMAAERAGIQG